VSLMVRSFWRLALSFSLTIFLASGSFAEYTRPDQNSTAALRILYARLFHMLTNNDHESELAFFQKYAEQCWTATDSGGTPHSRTDTASGLEDVAAGRSLADLPNGAYYVLDAIINEGDQAIVKTELREPTEFLTNAEPHSPETTIVHYRDIWEPTHNGWRWVSREESAPESANPQ
jgi:hypothetical protein